jgi:hypothetical protein
VLLALALACRSASPPDPIDLALRRGAHFLVTRQSTDGGFRSKTYSALRDGWSLTPLDTLALRMAPQEPAIAAAYQRGVDFTASLVTADGVRKPPEVGYPLHAYSIGALVLGAPDNVRHRSAHAALVQATRGLQLGAATGWSESDISFGGWGYAWEPAKQGDPASGELPTANLSATIVAIGALALGGVKLDDPALVTARAFVANCRNADGGFYFSPADVVANKAGQGGGTPRSYGSMTADGLRAMIRLGKPLDDPDVKAAAAWLEQRFDATKNPGAFGPGDEVRRESSYYYWAWTAAHAARHLGKRAWAEALAAELVRRQLPDGSWRNGATEMREDDPLVATPFAIAALAIASSVIAGEVKSHAY